MTGFEHDDKATLHTDEATLHTGDLVDADGTITALAERLVAGVERRETARVKVTRRIVHDVVTLQVPVQREELVVEYPEGAVPGGNHGAVRGSTEVAGSEVVGEYVLHELVPRVEFDVVPREKVRLVVDTQRSVVEVTDNVSREVVEVDEHTDLH